MRKKDLHELVKICEDVPVLHGHLRFARELTANAGCDSFKNSLSGSCVGFSTRVADTIRSHVPEANPVKRTSRLHTCLEYETDDAGVLVVDPTLGQFTVSRHIFCGSEAQLRTAFLNRRRRFLFGTRYDFPFEVTLNDRVISKGTRMTREDWFDILYQPLYRSPWFIDLEVYLQQYKRGALRT